MTPKVSVNLITLNEQRNIAGCLRSLGWADEIVVVDGGSSDATVRIAREFTDRVFLHPFDDFANQRNRARECSRGEWIFSIDADERVDSELAAEIRESVANAAADCHRFWVPIRSSIFGRRFRYCGTQGERKQRLFRRTRCRWTGAVHEIVTGPGWIGSLRNAIDHQSTPDMATYMRKLDRYSSFETAQLLNGRRGLCSWPWLRALETFARLYVGKLGFLDGPEGLRFCILSAFESWLVYQRFQSRFRETRALRNSGTFVP